MNGFPYHVHECPLCGAFTPCTADGDAYSHGTDCESCNHWIDPVSVSQPDGAA